LAKHTILIIEDESGIAEALQYMLIQDGFDARWEADGDRGLDAFMQGGIDLVVLDLMLPGMNGEDVCRAIRKRSDVPILMLTAKDTEVDKVLGLELGADDYVTKPFSSRELLARVHAILRRPRGETSNEVLTGGGISLDHETMEVIVRGADVSFTPKEFDLLEFLMERPNKVIRREVLLDEIWGVEFTGDSRTLDVHIKRIRGKCEVDSKDPHHILTVRGVGYRFVP
jgi:two-component system response regulator RegX3